MAFPLKWILRRYESGSVGLLNVPVELCFFSTIVGRCAVLSVQGRAVTNPFKILLNVSKDPDRRNTLRFSAKVVCSVLWSVPPLESIEEP